MTPDTSTSTALANLALHQLEPDLVESLATRKFRYSRFVDDVNVSTEEYVSNDELKIVVQEVRGLMERSGYRPKRTKQFVGRRGQNFSIHNLNVELRATVPLAERKRIRAMVYQLEMQSTDLPLPASHKRELEQAAGCAARVRSLHPREGGSLVRRIQILRKSFKE